MCSSWEREGNKGKRVRNSPADTKVRAEGWEKVFQGMEQPMEEAMVEPRSTAALGGPHTAAGGWCPKWNCGPWRAHAGAVSWQELWPVERKPHRSRFILTAHGKDPVCEGLSCGRDPTLDWGKSVRKEQQRWRVMDRLQSLFPIPWEVEELGTKQWSWAWEEAGLGGRGF